MIEVANTNMIDDIGLGRLLENGCKWMVDIMRKTPRILNTGNEDRDFHIDDIGRGSADIGLQPSTDGILGEEVKADEDDIIFDDSDTTGFDVEPNENDQMKGYI